MGNCIIHESQEQWGGEDWGPAVTHSYHNDGDNGVEFSGSNPRPATKTEVKLKITRKQLQELIGNTDLQGLSVQEALKQLRKMSAEYETQQITSSRSRLQTIPEANSFHSSC